MIAIRRLTKMAVFAAAFVLYGCAKHHKVDAVSAPPQPAESASQTYGADESSDYSTEVKHNESGEVINAMTAPSNQTYYFDFDSNVVRSADNDALTIQANYLAAHPQAKVRLEGNTDNRGSREYNIGLGWRRDQAIAHMLEQHGVNASQIDMVSYGKEHPVATGDDENAWHLNRRVELVYEGN